MTDAPDELESAMRRCRIELRDGIWSVACSDDQCTYTATTYDLHWAHVHARGHLKSHNAQGECAHEWYLTTHIGTKQVCPTCGHHKGTWDVNRGTA